MSYLLVESLSDAHSRAIMVRCFCDGCLRLEFAIALFDMQNVCVRNRLSSDRLRT